MTDIDALIVGGDLMLYGTVGDDFFGEGFTARQVAAALAGMSGDITVRVNSGGGNAFEGAAIHSMLAGWPGTVTVRVEGIAASAASLIAMAGDEIEMADGAMLMIHDPSAITMGTADDHRDSALMLDKIAESYARIYAGRSGRGEDDTRAIMRRETWMDADEAVEMGFATRKATDKATRVAAFDFTAYANAPEALRVAARASGWVRQPVPAAAAASTLPMEARMTDKVEAVETVTAKEVPEVTAKAAAPVKKPDPEAAAKAALMARRDAVVARFGDDLTARQAHDIAAAAKDEAEALMQAADAVISKKIAASGPEISRIVRDEGDTRAEGVRLALEARMQRKAPESDKARPFMGASIVEMAAEVVGHRGRIGHSYGDRERVLMSAFHSTSDFPAIFENALNKSLAARYMAMVPTYRNISRQMTFNDFRAHPVVRAGDFPTMTEVMENGEIKAGTFGEAKESVTAKAYGVQVRLSRHMLVNDDLDAIQDVLSDQGRMVAEFEDATFFAMFLSGANADGPTLNETTRQVFNTTDGTKAGSGGAISVATLSTGRAAMRKRKSVDGSPINIPAAILLVGPDKETEAQQVVAPIQAQQAGNVNPFSGTLRLVVSEKITGNAWYMFAEPGMYAGFRHGYLSGYEAPRTRIEEPFGQQGVMLSIEHDFGVGAVDFRPGYKNPGA